MMIFLQVAGMCCLLAILGGVLLGRKDTPKSKDQMETKGLNDKNKKS